MFDSHINSNDHHVNAKYQFSHERNSICLSWKFWCRCVSRFVWQTSVLWHVARCFHFSLQAQWSLFRFYEIDADTLYILYSLSPTAPQNQLHLSNSRRASPVEFLMKHRRHLVTIHKCSCRAKQEWKWKVSSFFRFFFIPKAPRARK